MKSFKMETTKCYLSHTPLHLTGVKGTLYGGNCGNPLIKNADIYVSLQSGSYSHLGTDPWDKKVVHEVVYPIDDGGVPKNLKRFKKMIKWLCTQLHEGQTVHVGCIGGHGRTGLVLSAIVAMLTTDEHSIQWVREHYCDRAVESQTQMEFLQAHFGLVPMKPSRTWLKAATGTLIDLGIDPQEFNKTGYSGQLDLIGRQVANPSLVRVFRPKDAIHEFVGMESSWSIWRK